MSTVSVDHVWLELGEFNFLLPRKQLAGVQQVGHASAPETYPLISLPEKLTGAARLFALFDHPSQPFSIACQHLEFIAPDDNISLYAVPSVCYDGLPPFSALCRIHDKLACVCSTAQLLALAHLR